jgi:hypothetical protein
MDTLSGVHFFISPSWEAGIPVKTLSSNVCWGVLVTFSPSPASGYYKNPVCFKGGFAVTVFL